MATARRVPARVFPPGDFIREELESREWTQADLAAILKKPLPAVNEIILGKKAITPETAKALGDAFGTGPEFWLSLESAYRLSLSEPADADVARRAAIFSAAPVKDIIKRGWIGSSEDTDELEANLLSFFRAKSLNDVQARKFAARKSSSYSETTMAEWAWYCFAVKSAESFHVGQYSEQAMRTDGLKKLHRLISSEDEVRKVPQVLADFGIRFVVIQGLPKMQVDGAAFWVGDDMPAIAMSMRFDRLDFFWFTLAHEIKHILDRDDPGLDTRLVGKDRIPTDDKPEMEKGADLFASNFLVPGDEITKFIMRVRPYYSKVLINQFANRLGVHPGIVVGQLQHRREIGWTHSRETLAKVREIVTSTACTDGWGSEPEQE